LAVLAVPLTVACTFSILPASTLSFPTITLGLSLLFLCTEGS
jgi:hypothetical protein